MQAKSYPGKTGILSNIDTIVHLGAGRCSELEEYLSLQLGQLVLVEADVQIADALQKRLNSIQNSTVRCVAVSGTPGQATLYRYNLPDVDSLHPASGLLDLYPGLKLIEKQQVQAISPVELIQPLKIDTKKENRLVIDLPGEELPVLVSLHQAQQLDLFSQIYLYCGCESLYDESEPASKVIGWLQELGFALEKKDDCRDPDRPLWVFCRNTLYLVNRNLQHQVEQLFDEKSELLNQITLLKEQVHKLTNAHDDQLKLAAEFQQKLAAAAEQKDTQARIIADLELQVQELTSALEEQTKLAAERFTQLEIMTRDKEEQLKIATDYKMQITKLESTENEQRNIIENQKTELLKVNSLQQEAQKRYVNGEQQLQEMASRQKLLEEELFKAEGQIDLIKDLVFRDSGI